MLFLGQNYRFIHSSFARQFAELGKEERQTAICKQYAKFVFSLRHFLLFHFFYSFSFLPSLLSISLPLARSLFQHCDCEYYVPR